MDNNNNRNTRSRLEQGSEANVRNLNQAKMAQTNRQARQRKQQDVEFANEYATRAPKKVVSMINANADSRDKYTQREYEGKQGQDR